MAEIKAVVVDVDGTLTDRNKVMFVSAVEALRKVQDKGTIVSVVTGNVLPVALGISTYVGLRGPIIAENGGMGCYQEKIYQLFDGELPWKAYEHLRTVMPVERLFTDNWRKTEVGLKRSNDLDKVLEALKGWDLNIEATGFAIHIMNKGHGKIAGVRKMAEIMGLKIEEIAAFGDSDNDVCTLSQCGYGVAVANASEAAKKAAKYVASKPHADGVIEGLELLGLL